MGGSIDDGFGSDALKLAGYKYYRNITDLYVLWIAYNI